MRIQNQIIAIALPLTLLPGGLYTWVLYDSTARVLDKASERMQNIEQLSESVSNQKNALRTDLFDELRAEQEASLERITLSLNAQHANLSRLLDGIVAQPAAAIYIDQANMRQDALKRQVQQSLEVMIETMALLKSF